MPEWLLAATVLLCLTASGRVGGPAAKSPSQRTPAETARMVQAAASLLRTEGAIDKAEIVHMPNEVLTYLRVSPEELERSYYFKLEVREFSISRLATELGAALENSKLRPTTDEGDLRWGCIFYDDKGARVLTVHFDARGRCGFIDGIPVAGGEQIVEVLARRCSCLWAGQYSGE